MEGSEHRVHGRLRFGVVAAASTLGLLVARAQFRDADRPELQVALVIWTFGFVLGGVVHGLSMRRRLLAGRAEGRLEAFFQGRAGTASMIALVVAMVLAGYLIRSFVVAAMSALAFGLAIVGVVPGYPPRRTDVEADQD